MILLVILTFSVHAFVSKVEKQKMSSTERVAERGVFAFSHYQHLIKELWRHSPLKVMIRIQHEERKGRQQLAW